ncbi:uncharacterized protein BJ212DRAFT_1297215 [Suillus subaureus]|uniref:DUF6532 domain-containing protein n=1 Tax=Suillus subaureus TaxID=48587 RepID=A0A9P7EIK5_9AGAM|nr:uncharacterized protein BJ212DRAFT_1297215 [Suillus subaureus]KAG1821942.1 hypothetical protein BJ212DRAFT_1297215 [Suillus subaureus]
MSLTGCLYTKTAAIQSMSLVIKITMIISVAMSWKIANSSPMQFRSYHQPVPVTKTLLFVNVLYFSEWQKNQWPTIALLISTYNTISHAKPSSKIEQTKSQSCAVPSQQLYTPPQQFYPLPQLLYHPQPQYHNNQMAQTQAGAYAGAYALLQADSTPSHSVHGHLHHPPQIPIHQPGDPYPCYPQSSHHNVPALNDQMVQVQADAYAGAYALLQGEGAPPSSQPNMDSRHTSQWGAAHLVALAPHHLGETVHGERTQGVIQPMAHRYRELAKEDLYGLVFKVTTDTDAAPDTTMHDAMINMALQTAKTELFGQSMVKELKGIHDYMVSSLADMYHGFKAHAMNIVHLSYNLCQPLFLPVDNVSHKESIIPKLLKDLQFLHLFEKTANNQEIKCLLENPVLIHMIINTLAGGLLKVLDGQLDRLFRVCGATLYCVLKAHITGKLKDVLVNLQTFDDIYKEIMDYINQMIHTSDDLSAWFDAVQQQMIY